MYEANNYYTKDQIDLKIKMVDTLLKNIDKMDIETLKEEYNFYSDTEPLFSFKYSPYTKETLLIVDKDTLLSYFKLGLNMFKSLLERYDYLNIF